MDVVAGNSSMKISKPDGRSGETRLFFKRIINHYGKEIWMTS
jgi:hypothetical protein